jgi:hypothetical protein
MKLKIVRQLIKEFWMPLVFSVLWTVYVHLDQSIHDLMNIQNAEAVFVKFFGLSFWFAQWNRVKKQIAVEGGLSDIHTSVKQMLIDLEVRSNDVVSQITGGDSICHLMYCRPPSPTMLGQFALIHQGKHPLYNVNARIIDVDIWDQIANGKMIPLEAMKSDINIKFGDLTPGQALFSNLSISLGNGELRRFSIFFSARNGNYVQQLRLRKINDIWLSASKIDNVKTPFEQVQDGYPRNDRGDVDW